MKRERGKQRGREGEGGLVVKAACTCNPEGEGLLPPLLVQAVWEIV